MHAGVELSIILLYSTKCLRSLIFVVFADWSLTAKFRLTKYCRMHAYMHTHFMNHKIYFANLFSEPDLQKKFFCPLKIWHYTGMRVDTTPLAQRPNGADMSQDSMQTGRLETLLGWKQNG